MNALALRGFIRLSAFASLALLPLPGWASAWQVSVDEHTGLPTVSRGGGPVMKAKFDFWAANWSWTGFYTDLKVNGPYHYTLLGKNKELDFDLAADIRKEQAQTLSWTFDLDAHSRKAGVMGAAWCSSSTLRRSPGPWAPRNCCQATAAGGGATPSRAGASKCASSPLGQSVFRAWQPV